MNILEQIIITKHKEVEALKQHNHNYFEKQPLFKQTTISLKKNIETNNNTNIIAEYKRQSPSKGIINNKAIIDNVVKGYEVGGAVASSILTDVAYFGGSLVDLQNARNLVSMPLLRKDFIIDEVQLLEAKAAGADVILLIAACLSAAQVKQLTDTAINLGLEVLLELHNEKELKHINNAIHFVGINNRDLKSFTVNMEQSIVMQQKVGKDFITIAESGLHSVADVQLLCKAGFDAFLIGELFMKQENPEQFFTQFINECNATS